MPTTLTPPKNIWPFFVLGFLGLALFLLGSKALLTFSSPAVPEDAARAQERLQARATLDAETRAKLENYAWVDRAKGQVQIPIAEAMRITATRLAAQAPHPAGPVNPPPVTAPAPKDTPPAAAAEPSAPEKPAQP